jgi:GTP-binding protein
MNAAQKDGVHVIERMWLNLVIKNVSLETVCGITSKLPEGSLPEVAFAGRSNVGKSSLINALMNRKSLARTSSQPGKTQTINYYNVNNALYFVDLPGYGYAKANEKVKAQWGKMVENYLHKSKKLRRVFLLVDIRHEPTENDKLMYRWIVESGYEPVIIATKLDKIKRSQVQKQTTLIRSALKAGGETLILPFSALNRQGREEIYQVLDALLEEEG